MPIAKVWTDALANARACTAGEAKHNISLISHIGSIALREALVLFAVAKSGRRRPDIGQLEKITNANAASIFFVADSLALKDLVRTDRNDKDYVFVELTDKGRALVDRCLRDRAEAGR